VTDRSQAPTGFARRSRRLSDQETEQRMLQVAVAMVHRTGLTVSLDHLSFEDIIRDADVSRSAVYRRWPYKDLFFSDLVKELARDATPTIVNDEIDLMRRVVAEHPDWLETPELRHDLLGELFRQLALFDFQTIYGSAGWRTYFALHATVMSLAEGDLRDAVQASLAKSERSRNTRVANAWEQLAGLFGYRLRPEVGATFEAMATLLSATMRGLVVMALSSPEIATYRAQANPFGAPDKHQWSLAAMGLGSVASAYLEPDPAIHWDDQRINSLRQTLSSLTPESVTARGGQQ
jgi:AcrR family transcriptional regulator